MPAEIIYSVFVSSTFDDLREERGELQKALLQLKCFPIGMELFPSSDDETWEFIKRQIDRCDYYVVVIAGRYGSLGPSGLSTEMEYDYARSIGTPILAFIHGDPAQIPAGLTEQDQKCRENLESFRSKTKRSIAKTYTNPHELAVQVMVSLVSLMESKLGVGFIRANQTVDAIKYADLMEENNRLKDEVNKLQRHNTRFVGADERLELTF